MSTQTSDNNKRMAKNTLVLYFRLLFRMAVSLYAINVILMKGELVEISKEQIR